MSCTRTNDNRVHEVAVIQADCFCCDGSGSFEDVIGFDAESYSGGRVASAERTFAQLKEPIRETVQIVRTEK